MDGFFILVLFMFKGGMIQLDTYHGIENCKVAGEIAVKSAEENSDSYLANYRYTCVQVQPVEGFD